MLELSSSTTLFCPAFLLHPESLPFFSDSCTQRSVSLAFIFIRALPIYCMYRNPCCSFELPNNLSMFFSQHINLFIPESIADILTGFQILFPNVAGNHFFMLFAFCTFRKIWTVFAVIPIRCPISKGLIRRTDIAIMIFIIDIVVFLKEAFSTAARFLLRMRTDISGLRHSFLSPVLHLPSKSYISGAIGILYRPY